MKRVKFIYNPSSGETKIGEKIDEVIRIYQNAGYTIVPYRLDFRQPAEDMADSIDGHYHHILIAGGDGTVNYVVNAMKRAGIDIPIAIIPAGTANDFALMLGTSQNDDIGETCERILQGRQTVVDVGKVNGEYFVNVFSCGFFTDISQRTPTVLKNTFGKLAYYVSGIGELKNYHQMDVVIKTDGGDFEGKCLLFLVFNGKTAGQLPIAYLSEVDDGLLDLIIVSGNPIKTLRAALRIIANLRNETTYPEGIEHIRCSYIRAECSAGETTDIDGQPGPCFPLEITCEHEALKIIIPKQKKQE